MNKSRRREVKQNSSLFVVDQFVALPVAHFVAVVMGAWTPNMRGEDLEGEAIPAKTS